MSFLGTNKPCPCGSGIKYKKCCYGTVDWDALLKCDISEAIPYLTLRGRNLAFLHYVDSILNLDRRRPVAWSEVKKSMTIRAVQDIAEAVTVIWPKATDVGSALKQHDPNRIAALHIGSQQSPEHVVNAVARHALYADKILVFDPLVHPLTTKPEYSALHNPAGHIFNTLKHLRIWIALAPWIESGIVEIVRGPSDFDSKLKWHLLQEADGSSHRITGLTEAINQDVESLMKSAESHDMKMLMVLGLSNEQLTRMYIDQEKPISQFNIDEFIKYVRSQEESHPYFTQTIKQDERKSQITTTTSGAGYAESSMVANIANAYLFTDLKGRWLEIQHDAKLASGARQWDAFSKAFSEASIPTFQNVPLPFALRMRQEGRMETMRSFLRKVWHSGQINDFDAREAIMFADQFRAELEVAQTEWSRIDSDLIKWIGADSLVASAAAAFSTGEIIPAAGWAFAATSQVVSSTLNRHNFRKRYPAAMFLQLQPKA
jgi:hypothetical protein